VSDRGDHDGDDLPPADPWGADPPQPDEAGERDGPSGRGRRLRWRRSGHEAEEAQPDDPVSEEPVAEEPAPGEPVPEEPVPEEPVLGEPVPGEPVPEEPAPGERVPEEPVPEEPLPEEPLVVDTPAWVEDLTLPAEHVEAEGFSDDLEVPADDRDGDRSGEPAIDPLPEVPPTPTEEDGEEPGGPRDEAPVEPVGADGAGDGPYGVSTSEVFAALTDDVDDDLGEWESFVGDAAPQDGVAPAPAAEAEAVADGGGDAGRWSRRRRREAAEAASEPDEGAVPDEAWVGAADPVEDALAPTPYGRDRGDDDVWLVSEQPLIDDRSSSGPLAGSGDEPLGAAGEERPGDDDDDALGEFDEWASDRELDVEEEPSVTAPYEDDVEDEFADDAYASSVTLEHRGLAEEIVRAGAEELEWQPVSASMPGLGTGVVGFDDVADLGTDEDEYVAPEHRPSDLGARIFTGLILVGFLLGSLWVGPEAFAVFIGLLVMLGLGEYYTALRVRRFRPIALFGYLGGAGLLAGVWFHGPLAVPVAVVLTTVVTFFVYAFAPLGRDALTNGGLTVLGVLWIPGAASFAFPLVRAEGFRVLILTVVAVTVAMDVGAFAVGRMWGTRALAPVLSPNKSIEGLVGGIAAAFAAAVAAAWVFEEIAVSDAVALAVVVTLVAPIGDLAESMVKRSLGIKDMGTILPGHGGILDRVDAFLFVLPGAWVLFKALELIG
jgi:phosphatidate cytidylyltransferase